MAIEDHNICSHAASHQKLVREQILAILGVDNFQLSDQYYYRLYGTHALIRHYLITGRKYVLIKEYALNKHVRLLTRLYGIKYPLKCAEILCGSVFHRLLVSLE